jgi:hypothetical protein
VKGFSAPSPMPISSTCEAIALAYVIASRSK